MLFYLLFLEELFDEDCVSLGYASCASNVGGHLLISPSISINVRQILINLVQLLVIHCHFDFHFILFQLLLLLYEDQVEFDCLLLLAQHKVQFVDLISKVIKLLCQLGLAALRAPLDVELYGFNLVLAPLHVLHDRSQHLLLFIESLFCVELLHPFINIVQA